MTPRPDPSAEAREGIAAALGRIDDHVETIRGLLTRMVDLGADIRRRVGLLEAGPARRDAAGEDRDRPPAFTDDARLKTMSDAINGFLSPADFETAMGKDPELRRLWDNRMKRIDRED